MVGIALQPQPGSNYIAIVDEAFRRLELMKKDLPEDIQLDVAMDKTISIRKAISEVKSTIMLAFVLVLMVIFFFLRNWRTTLIPVVLIPKAIGKAPKTVERLVIKIGRNLCEAASNAASVNDIPESRRITL
jgi:multidrug efflux pump